MKTYVLLTILLVLIIAAPIYAVDMSLKVTADRTRYFVGDIAEFRIDTIGWTLHGESMTDWLIGYFTPHKEPIQIIDDDKSYDYLFRTDKFTEPGEYTLDIYWIDIDIYRNIESQKEVKKNNINITIEEELALESNLDKHDPSSITYEIIKNKIAEVIERRKKIIEHSDQTISMYEKNLYGATASIAISVEPTPSEKVSDLFYAINKKYSQVIDVAYDEYDETYIDGELTKYGGYSKGYEIAPDYFLSVGYNDENMTEYNGIGGRYNGKAYIIFIDEETGEEEILPMDMPEDEQEAEPNLKPGTTTADLLNTHNFIIQDNLSGIDGNMMIVDAYPISPFGYSKIRYSIDSAIPVISKVEIYKLGKLLSTVEVKKWFTVVNLMFPEIEEHYTYMEDDGVIKYIIRRSNILLNTGLTTDMFDPQNQIGKW